jgi:5-methyltetrahydrofolate--homocysteine methyltransferase
VEAKLEAVYNTVVIGDKEGTEKAVQHALGAGIGAEEILQQGLISPMNRVGELFEAREYFVPEMLVAARAMQAGLDLLRPLLVASGVKPLARVVMGTVKGDLHDIGKNLVCMMLEGAGFEVIDLGADQSPENFLQALDKNVQLLGMSALLTTTMPNMKVTIEALEEAGIRDRVKVMVGGAPVTEAWACEIGADGYAPDAASAVRAAKQLLGLT